MNYVLAGMVAALACAPAMTAGGPARERQAQLQGDQWSWHGAIAAGKMLRIRGVSGSIEAVPARGSEVLVTATKRGRGSDPDDVKIEVVQDAGSVIICAVYPGRRNHCGAGDDYEMNTSDNDVEVRFHAEVPAGVAFTADNVNGGIEVDSLAGPVKASTVNGGVRIETAADDATGRTVNGSVTAVIRGAGSGALDFETTNGGITVSLPRNLNADLEAATVNGSIETDFPITVSGHLDRQHLDGRIGQGGRRVHVETVNGSIHLRAI